MTVGIRCWRYGGLRCRPALGPCGAACQNGRARVARITARSYVSSTRTARSAVPCRWITAGVAVSRTRGNHRNWRESAEPNSGRRQGCTPLAGQARIDDPPPPPPPPDASAIQLFHDLVSSRP